MKLESLVIGDQHAPVNTFPGLVHTARHTMGVDCSRSRYLNRKEGAYQGVVGDWGEVVTRYPYRKVGMDHLLSRSFSRALTLETSGQAIGGFQATYSLVFRGLLGLEHTFLTTSYF